MLEVGRDFIEEDGSVRMKFGWWRNAAGLTITGRGFQATGLSFPTEGCWEVTGELAGTTLTFVTLVRKKASP